MKFELKVSYYILSAKRSVCRTKQKKKTILKKCALILGYRTHFVSWLAYFYFKHRARPKCNRKWWQRGRFLVCLPPFSKRKTSNQQTNGRVLVNSVNMVKRCVAGGCGNSATTDISLHYFPVNAEIRDAWTTAVKQTRDGWDGPTKHSVLCSEHFPVDCFKQETSDFARGMMTEMGLVYRRRRALKADAIPTLFVSSSVKVSSKKNLSQAAAKRNQAQQVKKLIAKWPLKCL